MSGLRNLVPSTALDQSSGSSPSSSAHGTAIGSSNGTSGGASGGSGGAAGGSSGGTGGGDSTRRRRNAGNVSLIACTECRHARQKVR